MQDTSRDFLLELLDTPSPSGFEAPGQRVWAAYVGKWADSVETDPYGSAWATRLGERGDGSPRVMLEAHADEIGFMVKHITDEGFLHVTRIGGADRAVARGRQVRILGDRGEVPGIVSNTAIHLRETKDEKAPELHELCVDVGASSRDDVLALGIRVGHPIVYADGARELFAGRLTGRALDNRIGGFIIAEVLARIAAGDRSTATLQVVNCVQEEIGGHGARMVSYRLQPDVAIVLDVTHATDSPGIDRAKHGDVKLGGGPSLTHGRANHPAIVERLQKLAAEKEIPVQHEAMSLVTGTDTDSIFNSREGIPSALVSLPMRYMHSLVETVALDDVERCIELLSAFVLSIRESDEFRVSI